MKCIAIYNHHSITLVIRFTRIVHEKVQVFKLPISYLFVRMRLLGATPYPPIHLVC